MGLTPSPPCLKETAELVGDGIPNHDTSENTKSKAEICYADPRQWQVQTQIYGRSFGILCERYNKRTINWDKNTKYDYLTGFLMYRSNKTQCQLCKRLTWPIIPHFWYGMVWKKKCHLWMFFFVSARSQSQFMQELNIRVYP